MKRQDIRGYDLLEELAYNLIWSWDHSADKIWLALDEALWIMTRNPLVLLQTVSTEKLTSFLADPAISKTIQQLMISCEDPYAKKQTWYQKNHAKEDLQTVAYFSMEFMLSESLPIYSGGLGNVAGDQLKSINDLGVPVVAVGLLYQQGYFRQIIDKEGAQQALFPYNSPEQLPIRPVRLANGEWLRIEIHLPGWSLWLRVWEVKVGRVTLYLLDSNDVINYPPYRAITSELYGGNPELRLQQELVLGIGGWRLLKALNIQADVCHLNEGHAAFAILERAKHFMDQYQTPFDVALTATRAGNLFTTHTAVTAGFDCFDPELIEKYLSFYATDFLKISIGELLALGRLNPHNEHEPFNMAYLAMHGSGAVNGVSQLHGKVSRAIFAPLFPRMPLDEIPIGHVTNGVHMRSWDCATADALWTKTCGDRPWLEEIEVVEKKVRAISDEDIWNMRNDARKQMMDLARDRLSRLLAARGAPETDVERAKRQFDPHVFTMGFGRRFATYKRPTMLLHDPERLIQILTNKERPVQLVLAGKAHPADKPGQALIQQWMQFINRPEVRPHVVFLSDYDMLVAERLVAGVDLWINTPRRPWEACGTSGMKVLVNGGLNLSELDGWWAEAYTPQVGWAIGDGNEHDEDPNWDAQEATRLYDLLENEVIPDFYNRNREGIPTNWVSRVRESMAQLTARYCSNRTVRDYVELYYLPAAENYRKRSADKALLAHLIVDWKQEVIEKFANVRFGEVKVETKADQHYFEVEVFFDDLNPDAVKVELFANGSIIEMRNVHQHLYSAKVASERPISDFTPRVVPYFPQVAIPLEINSILWQR